LLFVAAAFSEPPSAAVPQAAAAMKNPSLQWRINCSSGRGAERPRDKLDAPAYHALIREARMLTRMKWQIWRYGQSLCNQC
jgi:hypothetical protein